VRAFQSPAYQFERKKMNKIILAGALSVTLALGACGGGGGGDNAEQAVPMAPAAPETVETSPVASTPAPAPAPSPVTGSVSAPFKAGVSPGFFLTGLSVQSVGNPGAFVQQDSGSVTTVGAYSLVGDAAVRDISGDTTFAMGRWAAGTMTSSSSSDALSESSNAASHYLMINRSAGTLPTSGTLACDAGVFTTPSAISSGGASLGAENFFGTSTGSATLTFTPDNAQLAATVLTKNTNSSGTGNFSAKLTSPTSIQFSGQSIGLGATSAFLGLGDGTNGTYLVGGSYIVKLASGVGYTGVFKFTCK
jgi:hypothetical protein